MAIINLEISDEKCSEMKIDELIFEKVPFNMRDLSSNETDLIFNLLKELANKQIPLYPREESLKQRKKQDLARNILNQYSDFVDLGLIGLSFKKEHIYPF